MKNVLIALLAIIGLSYLTGCSTTSVEYLSHEEIVKQMQETPEKSLEQLSSVNMDEMRRKANLIPLEDLFGKDFEEIKKRKKARKEKSLLIKSTVREEKSRLGADYRHRDTSIKSQWNGTCTTFGGIAGVENLLNKPATLDLSERDSWSKYKQYSSRVFVEALSKEGNEVCREVDWGQNETYPKDTCKDNRKWRLGASEYISDNTEAAIDALDRGSVVYLGMSTPKDMLYCRSVIRTTTDFSSGGHAILIVGYKMDDSIKGGGYFIIKNSWGADCGDYGYQYLPFHICQRSDGYCIMWEFKTVVDNTGGVDPVDPPKPEYKWVEKCKRMWYWFWLKKKCEWVKVKVN